MGIHAGAGGILGKSARTQEVHLEPWQPIRLERRRECTRPVGQQLLLNYKQETTVDPFVLEFFSDGMHNFSVFLKKTTPARQ